MSYVQKVIGPEEDVVYAAQVHWIVLVKGIGHLLIGGAIYLALLALLPTQETVPLAAVLLLWGCIGLWSFICGVVEMKTTELAVTTKRVIAKRGLIRRETVELFLGRTETILVDQSVLGRLLGYGSISVGGVGGRTAPIRNVINPLGFRRAVVNEVEHQYQSFKAARGSSQ